MDEFGVKFQKCFHVCQISRYVLRITKIYGLLCLGCMVKKILAKGQPKIKLGQILQCPIYMYKVSNCSSWCVHAKYICFY